jgi:phenylpropionate dioxygenase-like ring-hydroxylating dioxygenase large terminal subunit
MFIKNAWYAAAWDFELLGDTVLERTLLGQSVILFRRSDSRPAALENRCCHRGAPLSLGRKEGDCIRCMYHGLKFDASGSCVEIPGQDRIPPRARVRSYPVVQRSRLVWIWPGDPTLADDALIPQLHSIEHPAWRTRPGYKRFAAPYLLIADNLLDFAHLSYVHENTFGGSQDIAKVTPEISVIGRSAIRIVRNVPNTVPAPYHQRLGKFTGRVNRWFDYSLSLSGMFIMTAGVQSVDAPEGNLDGALVFHSCQALTPETESSTHYFFSHANNFALNDPTITEASFQSVSRAFDEDSRMIEAQARVLAGEPGRQFMGIASDAALARYRRLYQAALDAEVQATPRSEGSSLSADAAQS